MSRLVVAVVCAGLIGTVLGCGSSDGDDSSTSAANTESSKAPPPENFAENPPPDDKNSNLKEYRVAAEIQANFGKGAVYNLEPFSGGSTCVNDKRNGPYGPTTADNDKSELWMYASVSFPDCFSSNSFQRWDFHLTKPVEGHYMINLGEGCVNGCPYKTQCEEWYKDSLHCETQGNLVIKLSR